MERIALDRGQKREATVSNRVKFLRNALCLPYKLSSKNDRSQLCLDFKIGDSANFL